MIPLKLTLKGFLTYRDDETLDFGWSLDQTLDQGHDENRHRQVGHDQDGFFRFWDNELRSALTTL